MGCGGEVCGVGAGAGTGLDHLATSLVSLLPRYLPLTIIFTFKTLGTWRGGGGSRGRISLNYPRQWSVADKWFLDHHLILPIITHNCTGSKT